ncbi:sensor domain-containing diguanylate cyclase [Paenibacillus sp. FSL H8-0548]|uniref:sensor domain-containing diguanylate cyclase n=1 Tax=Paenibacillus sp. FSL H8-0548 TaxID=1920422 RepID=UPI0015C3E56F|nr:sensor domain-containing diguanylate cyclase [Paenibacillus sp. FSL H8-0548]
MKKTGHQALFENNRDGVLLVDKTCQIIGSNFAFSTLTGYTHNQLNKQPLFFMLKSIAADERRTILRVIAHGITSFDTAIIHQKGNRVELSVSQIPYTEDGKQIGSYFIARNITEEKRATENLYKLAFYDELTGLPNRHKFNKDFEQSLAVCSNENKSFVLMMIDIDGFKRINDKLGHYYGDLVLKEIGNRLLENINDEQVEVSRFGGDELTVILNNVNEYDDIAELAKRIIKLIQMPIHFNRKEYTVTASIGIAVYPDHGKDTIELMRNADKAMYEVKKNGKNNYLCYIDKNKKPEKRVNRGVN